LHLTSVIFNQITFKYIIMKKTVSISRRKFLGTSAAAIAGLTIVPSRTVSGLGYIAPSDKLNVAAVGIGGKGASVISAVSKTENIVSLCDVDWSQRVQRVFDAHPKARRHKDYRVMLDKDKDIDGVIIATPDHTHAIVSLDAMRRGKHVYTEKPLTHTVREARMLTEAARKYKVATQMGNGGQATDPPRRLREAIWDGAIGPVREVHIWTDRANRGLSDTYWPQGVKRPEDTPAVPASLDWDLFIGPAPLRPYHPSYHPFNWRGWLDFGTGALGDMGCHGMDPIFRALKLKYPTNVQGVSTLVNDETYPLGSIVTYEFPARENMPPVLLTWYDGGLRPPVLHDVAAEGARMGEGGTLYIGEKGKILNDVIYPKSLRDSYTRPAPYIPSSPGHEMEWIIAAKGGEPAGSNFEWAGPLTETVLLGNIPLRRELRNQLNGQILSFDPTNLTVSMPEANKFMQVEYRTGWTL
jgi:predicted dehydrogenase